MLSYIISLWLLHNFTHSPFIIFSVDVADNVMSIFDTGPGMDGSDENSIVKWYLFSLNHFLSYIWNVIS